MGASDFKKNLEEAIQAYKDGDTTRTIGARYGVSNIYVSQMLRLVGVQMRPRGRQPKKKT